MAKPVFKHAKIEWWSRDRVAHFPAEPEAGSHKPTDFTGLSRGSEVDDMDDCIGMAGEIIDTVDDETEVNACRVLVASRGLWW